MSFLRLPRAVYEDIRAHGEEDYPAECCGALLGSAIPGGWQVHSMMRAANIHAQSTCNRYEIAPDELVKIANVARGKGLEIAGFYHSHPDQPAQWSATDLAEAHWLGCCYLITQIVQGRAAATNAFVLAGDSEEKKRFDPQAIQIAESSLAGRELPQSNPR